MSDQTLSIQECLDTLRAFKGARDALLGFDAVTAKLDPLLTALIDVERRHASLTADNERLSKANAALEDAKAQHDRRKRALDEQFATDKMKIDDERHKLLNDLDQERLRFNETRQQNSKTIETLAKAISDAETKHAKLAREISEREAVLTQINGALAAARSVR